MKGLDFGIDAQGKLQALLLVLLAVFMTAIGFGILSAPMNMKPILAILLKAFIGLVFGGIAAYCILHAVRAMRGKPNLPPELYARCLTCGERTPHELVCPVCAEPPQDRSTVIRVSSEDVLGQFFGALILTGVGCLGIFIMIGPYLDGERRLWALIAFFALGLLMFLVGIAGFWGFILALWNGIKTARRINFACRGPDRFTLGAGNVAWGRILFFQGSGEVSAPLAARGRPEGGYRVSPGDMSLAEALATFDAAGLIEMVDTTIYNWCLGDPSGKTRSADSELKRTIERSVRVKLSRTSYEYGGSDDDEQPEPSIETVSREKLDSHAEAISRYLARYLIPPQSLAEFKNRIDADPIHRTQLEMHAQTLRDRGIAVSGGLVDAVIEALANETRRAA